MERARCLISSLTVLKALVFSVKCEPFIGFRGSLHFCFILFFLLFGYFYWYGFQFTNSSSDPSFVPLNPSTEIFILFIFKISILLFFSFIFLCQNFTFVQAFFFFFISFKYVYNCSFKYFYHSVLMSCEIILISLLFQCWHLVIFSLKLRFSWFLIG